MRRPKKGALTPGNMVLPLLSVYTPGGHSMLHKDGLPVRPVVYRYSDPTYHLCHYLAIANNVDSDYPEETDSSDDVQIAMTKCHCSVQWTCWPRQETMTVCSFNDHFCRTRQSNWVEQQRSIELLNTILRRIRNMSDCADGESTPTDERIKFLLTHSVEKYDDDEIDLELQSNPVT